MRVCHVTCHAVLSVISVVVIVVIVVVVVRPSRSEEDRGSIQKREIINSNKYINNETNYDEDECVRR